MKITIFDNNFDEKKCKAFFMTEDGMIIGKPLLHIQISKNNCICIPFEEFEKLSDKYLNKIKKYNKLNKES